MTRGIYVIRCKPTGKVYVGFSKNIKQRWMNHQYKLRKGNHHSKYLQNSWNKYGAEALGLSITDVVRQFIRKLPKAPKQTNQEI